MPRSSRRAPIAALLACRCATEAVTFACAAAVLHAIAVGREPLPLLQSVALLTGVGLMLAAVLREARAIRASTGIAIGAVAAGVAWGLLLPTREADGLAVLTRLIGFGILAEAFLWRSVSIARGLTHWLDARNAAMLALVALTLAVVVPGVEAPALAPLAVLAILATGIALSLARTAEELALAGVDARGGASGGTATGTAFALGALALALAAFGPAVQQAVADASGVLGEALGRLLYFVALPIGYLAAFLVEFLRARGVHLPDLRRPPPTAEQLEQEALMLRAVEETRPLVFGAIEILIALAAVAAGILLVDRLTRGRAAELPPGASLEREGARGFGLREAFARLLPARAARRRRPRDDGSPEAAVRLAYWGLLELAERAGDGWRAAAETPDEHTRRLARGDQRWGRAVPIVRAFERLRYGEERPDHATVAAIRAALRSLEAEAWRTR